jgi:hypothetical protein
MTTYSHVAVPQDLKNLSEYPLMVIASGLCEVISALAMKGLLRRKERSTP